MLVEKWAEVGEPSVPARLAGARAFIELRMLDRAWVRLKDLVETETPVVEALVLAAEMFLLRGWPNKAKKAALRGLELKPGHPALTMLSERSHEAPTEPDEDAVEGEATPIADLIRVAEQFMAQGSYVRARTLLERVRRKVPDHRWAADLLWVMNGDFTAGEVTLADLCDRLGPELQVIADLPDDPEHTESAHLDDLPLQIEADTDRGFPSLFRNLDAATSTETRKTVAQRPEREVTAVSSMAELSDLLRRDTDPAGDRTDPHGDDTQIVRVVNKADGSQSADTAVDVSFNLADFRREMGAEVDPKLPEATRDYVVGPEDEDDSVVILTRRDESTDGRDATTDVGDAIQLEAATEKAAKESRGSVEDAGWARPPEPTPGPTSRAGARTPTPTARTSAPKVTSPPAGKTRTVQARSAAVTGFAWPWWVLVLSTVLFLGFVLFAAIAFVFALQ